MLRRRPEVRELADELQGLKRSSVLFWQRIYYSWCSCSTASLVIYSTPAVDRTYSFRYVSLLLLSPPPSKKKNFLDFH